MTTPTEFSGLSTELHVVYGYRFHHPRQPSLGLCDGGVAPSKVQNHEEALS